MVGGGVAGGLLGIWQGWRRSRRPEDRHRTLLADVEWIDTSSSAVLLAAFIMYFVVQAFQIPSGSMRETLREGDHLFVNKFIYGIRIPWTYKRVWQFRPIERGQVIVFLCPPPALSPLERARHLKKDFIKRAIGLPGDRIEIRMKQVWINGQPLREPYVHFRDPRAAPREPLSDSPEAYQRIWEEGRLVERAGLSVRDNFGPVTVPPGCYFVMGDNRDGSFDSRFWGPLSERYLKGKAWVLYWPLTRVKIIR
ncbi:MAG: signal peptidase I [Elusimicrobia bacterium]|nr:signal peptidase I [Elusimicrobiota bacterium]